MQNNNKITNQILFYLIAASLWIVSNNSLIAQTKTWTGASDTNWENASNWNPVGIPVATDDIIIPNTVNNPILQSGTIASVKSVRVQASAELTLQVSGVLNINGSGNSISNRGTISNSGEIQIGALSAISGIGIQNIANATFINEIGGSIDIDQTGASGIENDATFTNKGAIHIGANESIGFIGLWNKFNGTFVNDVGSSLHIDQTGSHGIYTEKVFTNKGAIHIGENESVGFYGLWNYSGTFTNDVGGSLHIDQTVFDGIYNDATFTNKAVIHIGANELIKRNGILNYSGTFTNDVGGSLHIDQTTRSGIENWKTFINKANIHIGAKESIGFIGLWNKNNGVFTNDTGGSIHIDQTVFDGIYNETSFTNKAAIHIGANGSIKRKGIWNFLGTFTNEIGGSLHIDQTNSSGIDNREIFTNEGAIHIDQTNSSGIDNWETFTNKAAIHIGANESIGGIGLWNKLNGTFINEVGGSLHIDQTGSHGIYTEKVFTNKAAIHIGENGSIQQFGLWIFSGTFTNEAESSLHIDQTIFSGIYNTANFNNKSCAKIHTTERLNNQSTFTNNGFLFANFNGTHINEGTFTNSGVIEDFQGAFNGVPIDNQGLIISPAMSEEVIPDVLQIGTNNDFTASTDWYDDFLLATNAGHYDQVSNTFSYQLPINSQTLYMQITDNTNACTEIVKINILPCLAEAGTLSSNENTICTSEAIEVSTTENQTDNNYLQYFFIYTQNNLGITSYVDSKVGNSVSFEDFEAGEYLVCSYNESPILLPSPSPVTTNLDDIYQTGSIKDGCFDIKCTTITVPEAFEVTSAEVIAENNAAGQTIFAAVVCGGSLPYDANLEASGGFAAVDEFYSSSQCREFRVTFAPQADWVLTITDANGCSDETLIFTSEESILTPQIVNYTTTNETCVGDADGSISIEVEGGNDDCDEYTYTWSGSNGFSSTATDATTGNEIENLSSGNYNVTVTDCEGVTSVMENISVNRSNRGRGRGRGGCKTTGNILTENASLNVFPNPFGGQTSIEFTLSQTSKVWLTVYSIEGKKIAEILRGEEMEGEILQRYGFDAEELQNGVYILELQTESGLRQHQQLVVVK